MLRNISGKGEYPVANPAGFGSVAEIYLRCSKGFSCMDSSADYGPVLLSCGGDSRQLRDFYDYNTSVVQ